MAIHRMFKSTLKSCQYITADGTICGFVAGRFHTGDEKVIKELEQQIAAGHPHLYVDSAEVEVDTEMLDPIEQIKRKAIADYIAAQNAANRPENDRGNTVQGKLEGIVNSGVVGEGSSGSTGDMAGAISERLAAIKVASANPAASE